MSNSNSETNREQLEAKVRGFIGENFLFDVGVEDLSADESLTQAGILDSMGILELIMFVEDAFHFEVGEEDTLPENFDSINRIVNYIRKRLSEALAA